MALTVVGSREAPTVGGQVAGASAVAAVATTERRVAADAGVPTCAHEDSPAAIDPARPHLTLVDTTYAVPREHVPAELVDVSAAGLAGRGSIAVAALPDLRALVDAAGEAGMDVISVSGYRSYDDQARAFAVWEQQLGLENALEVSARAGHSEHQLGFALDFSSRGVMDPWTLDDWATTPEGAWLARHAWQYGWLMSYPPGTKDVTCYRYEPWHYRWVGREVAAEVHESGLTLRQYLWRSSSTAGAEP